MGSSKPSFPIWPNAPDCFLVVWQVDLDLGNYERFMDITLNRDNNITTGKIYQVDRLTVCSCCQMSQNG